MSEGSENSDAEKVKEIRMQKTDPRQKRYSRIFSRKNCQF